MDAHTTALWWARIRAAGPQLVDAGDPTPPGLVRLAEPGSSRVWLTPVLPNGAGPAVLDELDLPRPVLEQPNDTARVLAAALKSCWPDPSGPLWPGATAPFGQVLATFEALTGRDEVVSHRAVVGALRRLSWSGWLLWDEEARTVRLGPRVATWPAAELSTLRELWRSIPVAPEGEDPYAAVVTDRAKVSNVTEVTDEAVVSEVVPDREKARTETVDGETVGTQTVDGETE
ncbi:MAG: hypothetical protein ACRDNF_01590 [Streptosporangiaceae bacterium]